MDKDELASQFGYVSVLCMFIIAAGLLFGLKVWPAELEDLSWAEWVILFVGASIIAIIPRMIWEYWAARVLKKYKIERKK